jgi:hypothetical protein
MNDAANSLTEMSKPPADTIVCQGLAQFVRSFSFRRSSTTPEIARHDACLDNGHVPATNLR